MLALNFIDLNSSWSEKWVAFSLHQVFELCELHTITTEKVCGFTILSGNLLNLIIVYNMNVLSAKECRMREIGAQPPGQYSLRVHRSIGSKPSWWSRCPQSAAGCKYTSWSICVSSSTWALKERRIYCINVHDCSNSYFSTGGCILFTLTPTLNAHTGCMLCGM